MAGSCSMRKVLFVLALCLALAPGGNAGFVTRNETQFMHDGKPFYFLGFNAYWFIDHYYDIDGHKIVDEYLTAAQDLGLTVGRTWAFNNGLPKGPWEYDEKQFEGLDYVIYSAARHNVKLVLALGNLWNAYKSPEEFVTYATGSADQKTVLDFYSDERVRALYMDHMAAFALRNNTYTGILYKDDPTIMAWNILNEPRCPGCLDEDSQEVHYAWMADMVTYLKSVDPNHLVTASTEGFFMERAGSDLHLYNPGAGGQCEGEDWERLAHIPQIDYLIMHVYERHLELMPQPSGNPDWPNWMFCGFECYANWFVEYLNIHIKVAATKIKKPLVLEEFGVTWWKATLEDRKVLFDYVFERLMQSQATDGIFAGALFWNGVHNISADVDGYNVYIDRPAYFNPEVVAAAQAFRAAQPPLVVLAPLQTRTSYIYTITPGARTTPPPKVPAVLNVLENEPAAEPTDEDALSGPALEANPIINPPGSKPAAGATVGRRLLLERLRLFKATRSAARNLLIQDESLDGFRRGYLRERCALESAKTWRPYTLFNNTGKMDIAAEHARLRTFEMVQIIENCTTTLNAAP